MTDLKKLKTLAEAATPGSWQYLEFDPHSIPEACHGVLCTEDSYIGCDVGKKDGAFISAANPEAVLGLIARIDELSARNAKLETALEEIAACESPEKREHSPNVQTELANEALKEET